MSGSSFILSAQRLRMISTALQQARMRIGRRSSLLQILEEAALSGDRSLAVSRVVELFWFRPRPDAADYATAEHEDAAAEHHDNARHSGHYRRHGHHRLGTNVSEKHAGASLITKVHRTKLDPDPNSSFILTKNDGQLQSSLPVTSKM